MKRSVRTVCSAVLVLMLAALGWGVLGPRPASAVTIQPTAIGAWGGYQNGQIPLSALSAVPWQSGEYLRPDAEAALAALDVKYRAAFGHDLRVNSAYRSYQDQVAARTYWCNLGACGNAAVPGTSNHGWGLAVDIGETTGAAIGYSSPTYAWMKANGPQYGWVHPCWAEPGGQGPYEAWHFEYQGTSAGSGGCASTPPGTADGSDPSGGSPSGLPCVVPVTGVVAASGTVVVTVAALNARVAPSTDCSTGVVSIRQGQTFTRTGVYGSWWRIVVGGSVMWADSAYLAVQAPPVVDPPAVPNAASVIGVGDFNGDGRSDLVARKSDGTLWFYAGTGSSGRAAYAPAVKIGNGGWNAYTAIIGVGDFNGDGHPDLIARKSYGTLWFYAGTGVVSGSDGGYRPAVKIGNGGWNSYTMISAVGDFNGDGHVDLVAARADGTLWFYAGTGVVDATHDGYQPAVEIGRSGWNGYTQVVGVGDLGSDGHPDLLAMRADGSLWFYSGTGVVSATSGGYRPARAVSAPRLAASDLLVSAQGVGVNGAIEVLVRHSTGVLQSYAVTADIGEGYASAVKIGTSGWTAYTQVVGVGDFNGDGRPDLLAVRGDGTLWFYAGTGKVGGNGGEGYAAPVKIGNGGWNHYNLIVGVGDVTGDGHVDLVARAQDGSLWFYAGTGVVSATSEGYRPAVKIGNGGWNAYSGLVAGDFTGDGKTDLLGITSAGQAWSYAGTGSLGSPTAYFASRVPATATGLAGQTAVVSPGDMNGDGVADLLVRRADGSLWFVGGTRDAAHPGQVVFVRPVQIGRGWNAYRSLVSVGDFNGDGLPDFVGVNTSGSLWFYGGTGGAGVPSPAFGAAVTIGTGWNTYQ